MVADSIEQLYTVAFMQMSMRVPYDFSRVLKLMDIEKHILRIPFIIALYMKKIRALVFQQLVGYCKAIEGR